MSSSSDLELAALVGPARSSRRAPHHQPQQSTALSGRVGASSKFAPEAEEAVQDGYLKAFAAMGELRRQVLTHHLAHAHRHQRSFGPATRGAAADCASCIGNPWPSSTIIGRPYGRFRHGAFPGGRSHAPAGRQTARARHRQASETFRPVFVLREIEGLSVEETAEALDIPKETVKTRLLRARRRLPMELDPELREALRRYLPLPERIATRSRRARARQVSRRHRSVRRIRAVPSRS